MRRSSGAHSANFRRREHGVAVVGGDQRMRDGADATAAPPGGLRVGGDADLAAADRAGDVRGVAVAGLHAMVVVTGGHEDDRLAVRGAEHPLGVGRDQCAPREDAEIDGLEMGEEGVVALDRHHRLPRLDRVAVVERVDLERVPVVGAELEHRDRLVHPAEHGGVALEDLHHDARVATVGEQRRAGVVEVRVGVVALPHLLDGKIEHIGVEPLAAQLAAAGSRRLLRPSRQAASAASATSSWAARRLGRRDARLQDRARVARAHARAGARDGGPSSRRSRPRRPSHRRRRAPALPGGPRREPAPRARSRQRSSGAAGRRDGRRSGRAPSSPARPSRRCRSRCARRRGRRRARRRGARSPRARARRTRRLLPARQEPEARAAGDARRGGAGDDRDRDPRPLERKPRLGQRAAHVREHGERLGEPQRAADERRRHARREAPLDAGGRADRAVGRRGPPRPTRSGRARGRRSRAPCRRAAACPWGEGTVLRWTPARCSS